MTSSVGAEGGGKSGGAGRGGGGSGGGGEGSYLACMIKCISEARYARYAGVILK